MVEFLWHGGNRISDSIKIQENFYGVCRESFNRNINDIEKCWRDSFPYSHSSRRHSLRIVKHPACRGKGKMADSSSWTICWRNDNGSGGNERWCNTGRVEQAAYVITPVLQNVLIFFHP